MCIKCDSVLLARVHPKYQLNYIFVCVLTFFVFIYVCPVSGFRHGGVSRSYPARRGQRAKSASTSPRCSHTDPRSDAALAAFPTAGGEHVSQPHKPGSHFCCACTQVTHKTIFRVISTLWSTVAAVINKHDVAAVLHKFVLYLS